ncbi:hypothetical protein [Lentisalinibacter sediminis]|uniref:hypothetical protein n=1 Tax=Lentisalinibacter sediminis TaxID=2992237 RepID=UPI00386988C0
MGRQPWTGSPFPGAASGEGGMEHLETDVMRFMAILAFCLVAIFALVQSVPEQVAKRTKEVPDTVSSVTPQSVEPAPAAPPEAVPRPEPQPRPEPAPQPEPASQPQPVAATVPEPRLETPPQPTSEPSPQPATQPAPETRPDAAPAVPAAEPQPGFSLRFDSDAALVGLVERREVALYAFARDRVWRFMMVDGRPAFRTAAAPGQVHEMTPQTVPAAVLDTLRRNAVVPPGGVRWGVTLPPATAAALGRVIATNDGGELVIDADGFLRLEDPS